MLKIDESESPHDAMTNLSHALATWPAAILGLLPLDHKALHLLTDRYWLTNWMTGCSSRVCCAGRMEQGSTTERVLYLWAIKIYDTAVG